MTENLDTQAHSTETGKDIKSDKKKKLTAALIVGTVLIITTTYIIHWYFFNLHHAQTDNAQIDGHINYISSKISGNVSKVLVENNQLVKKGEILLKIDPDDYQIAVEEAKANLTVLQKSLGVIDKEIDSASRNAATSVDVSKQQANSSRIKIKEIEQANNVLQAQLEADKASLDQSTKHYNRSKYLLNRHSITQDEFDKIEAAYNVAKSQYNATLSRINQNRRTIEFARSEHQTAKTAIDQSKTLFTTVDVNKNRKNVTAAQINQAEVNLKDAELKLSYTEITAPVTGVVGKKTVEPGQVVQPGQALMVIVPDDDIWITANFKETQLEKIKVGQPVDIKVDAYPSTKFSGKVYSFSAATGARFSLIPPENASGNFTKVVQRVPVKILLDAIKDKNIHLVPGMNVVVTVDTTEK